MCLSLLLALGFETSDFLRGTSHRGSSKLHSQCLELRHDIIHVSMGPSLKGLEAFIEHLVVRAQLLHGCLDGRQLLRNGFLPEILLVRVVDVVFTPFFFWDVVLVIIL